MSTLESRRILDWNLNNAYGNEALTYLGPIPEYLSPDDNRPAYEQLEERSICGWHPEPPENGWMLLADDYVVYPGLRAMPPVAMAWLRDEKILVYPAGWICVVQRNGEFSIARMT